MPNPARRGLIALTCAALFLGVAWTLVTPAWQAPDENSHFAYIQHLAETGSLPRNSPGASPFSSEQRLAAEASNSDLAAAQRSVKMEWDPRVFERWRAAAAVSRRDSSGSNPAGNNPPFYYLTQVPVYLIGSSAGIFTRLELLRLGSLIWLGVAIVATWLLTGEVFGRRPLLQIASAGLVGLAPMVVFVSSSVSPDSMLYAAWAVAFWLGIRLLRLEAPSITNIGVFALSVGCACVVKATSYALLPAATFAVGVAVYRMPKPNPRKTIFVALLVAASALAASLGTWIVAARLVSQPATAQISAVANPDHFNINEFLSYLWQFYLPRTDWQAEFASLAPTIPVWDFLIKGVVGSFGWTEVVFDGWVYWLALALGAICVTVALSDIWRMRQFPDPSITVFFGLAAVTLMVGLHVSEYRQIQSGALNFFQGRYVLPLAPLAGLLLARAVSAVPTRFRAMAVGIVLAGLLIFNALSLAVVAARFYA